MTIVCIQFSIILFYFEEMNQRSLPAIKGVKTQETTGTGKFAMRTSHHDLCGMDYMLSNWNPKLKREKIATP